jgi:hypothetical protein
MDDLDERRGGEGGHVWNVRNVWRAFKDASLSPTNAINFSCEAKTPTRCAHIVTW